MKKAVILLIILISMILCVGVRATEKSDSGISLSDDDIRSIMKAGEEAGDIISFKQEYDRGYYALMMGKTEFETFLSTGKFADNSTKTAIVPFSEGGYAKYLSENGKWTFTGFKHPSGDGQPETESAEYFENLLDKSGLTDYSDVRVIDVPVYGARFLSVNCGGEPRLIAVSGGEDAGFESGALYTCSECEDIIRTYDFGDGLSDGSAAPARTWVPVVLISGAALIGLALFAVLTYKLKEKRPR